MRKIKFRVWDKLVNRFRNDLTDLGIVLSLDNGNIFNHFNPSEYLMERFELMQFTGLHDSKGKEIYEGDIVKVITDEDDEDSLEQIRWKEGDTEFPFGGWECSKNEGWRLNECEVIGNKFENPELLEKEGDN